jgi:hypothetical protein
MNKDVCPQEVDFNYRIRCSHHTLKPYVYCEMCMVRSEIQSIKEDFMREARNMISSCLLNINVTNDIMEKHRKQIEELQIEIQLLKNISQDVKS